MITCVLPTNKKIHNIGMIILNKIMCLILINLMVIKQI